MTQQGDILDPPGEGRPRDAAHGRWKTAGVVATLVVVLSVPLYLVRERRLADSIAPATGKPAAAFVGSAKCQPCHKPEFDKWRGSHHERAMAEATPETVLGDFENAEFTHFGVTSKFYRKDGRYFVFTPGPDGQPAEFQITHTFGWYPLQQYLIPFPGGRLQSLPIAWDVKEKRWYHLYPDRQIAPDDWLNWTRQGQNWNGMCAECHSTNLQKNYDLETDTYRTTWSEISVGCEACHGPGSAHVKWADLPEMGRPAVENYALAVKTSGLSSREQIELCAPCHSRRMSLGDNPHANIDFLDYGIPQLLTEGYYFPDGQILEEVYVYGSFVQSKMYRQGVRCSDCHDVHSTRRLHEGNALCLQCHKAAIYDTRDHHFHKKEGEKGEPIRSPDGQVLFEVGSGARCEQCHMPGRVYMGIDYRPDHSFRIPRPDLSRDLDAPNACNRCHVDKTTAWSIEAMAKWYGQRQRPHYGTTLAAGRRMEPEAQAELIRLAEDRLYPTLARATALSSLAAYTGGESEKVFLRALSDEEALMRYTALRYFPEIEPGARLAAAAPLLYDPVKAVRIEAARLLTTLPAAEMPEAIRKQLEAGVDEYRQALAYTGDFPTSRHNLGNLYSNLGRYEEAAENYRKAIEIDAEFFPAKVNLAMVYNRMGKNAAAEELLREVATAHPDQHEVKYSLGLLLAEEKKYEAAADYLSQAARGLPQRSRIHYNLGLLLQQLRRDPEAETSLKQALAIEPDRPEYAYALAVFYLQRQQYEKARQIAEEMAARPAARADGERLLTIIERQRQAK
ncbi:MAG: tetratricopeptide repeat protein [Desulfobacterales bacterium]